jgi:hypothetical protein
MWFSCGFHLLCIVNLTARTDGQRVRAARRPLAGGKEVVMKTRIIVGATLLALILVVPIALQAQMAGQQYLFHVDIPFPFTAAGIHLPAGHYHVYHPGDPYLLILQKDDNRARAVVYVHTSETDSKAVSTKLVFSKYGDQHFLAQAWTERDREMHTAFKCKAEQILVAQFEKPEAKVVVARK